jgi:hypothetical protein
VVTAKACGGAVEVSAARTEFTRVTARSSGELVLESAVVPQWTRRPDGSWADVDLTLKRASDGSLRPQASVADVRFSSGGQEPLVTLVRDGKTMSMAWPGRLPIPTVTGDSALYANVLPEVDLVVRATRTGFTHVLVVKSAIAAANPMMRSVSLAIDGDAKLHTTSGGGLRAMAGGKLLAWSATPVMWDSRAAAEGSDVLSQFRSPTRHSSWTGGGSSADGPGDSARVSGLGRHVDQAGALVLTPDPKLLGGPGVIYPVYIDPAWDVQQSRWAYANDANTSWNMTEPSGTPGYSGAKQARVGRNQSSGHLYRTVLEFPITDEQGISLSGKQITQATVRAGLDHTESCSAQPVYLYGTGSMAAALDSYGVYRSNWSAASLNSLITSLSVAANETSCSQPDLPLDFTGEAVRSSVDWAANASGLSAYTVVLSAAENTSGLNESVQARWKRFHLNNFWLIVTYNTTPNAPSAADLTSHAEYTAPAQACATGSGRPINRSFTPYLKATLTDPDSVNGPGSGLLSGKFAVEKWSGTGWAVASGWPKTVANISPGSKAEIQITAGLGEGDLVRWQVQTIDAGPLSSGWSPWCELTVDMSPPAQRPTVVSADGVYLEKTVQPNAQGSINKSGRFTLGANGVADIQRYIYRFDNGPEISVDAVNASGVPTLGGSATIAVTPSHAAENVLTVRSVDPGGNSSANRDFGFIVNTLSGPVAHWRMNEGSGTTLASAIPGGPTLNLAGGPSWTNGRVLGNHAQEGVDRAVQLDGNDDHGTAAPSTVDTSQSFSVSAWVRTDSTVPTGYLPILSKAGHHFGSFYLQYQNVSEFPALELWVPRTTEYTNPGSGRVAATSVSLKPELWTHVAASYDPASKTAKVYVTGVLRATATNVVATNVATGNFLVGTSSEGKWRGGIDEVRVWDRVIDPVLDIAPLLQPVNVGAWDFEDCGGSTSTDSSNYGHHGTFSHDPDQPGNPVQTSFEGVDYSCAANFNGTGGSVTTSDSVLRTDHSFTVGAFVRIDAMPTQNMTAVSQDGQWRSGFFLGATSVSGVPKWRFAIHRENVNPDVGPNTITEGTWPIAAEHVGQWVHLVGVFDANFQNFRLYVNGVKVVDKSRQVRWAATGPLVIGRGSSSSGGLPIQIEHWSGGIDRVWTYAGPMTDVEVAALYQQMS